MGRGEYGHSIGSNGVSQTAQGYRLSDKQHFAELFHERVSELDAAIQQADRDYATSYQTDWRPSANLKPGEGLDQSHFVLGYWQPFVRAWNSARPLMLTGTIDRARALILMSWAERYNDLKGTAGGSVGLETRAPRVLIHGSVGQTMPEAQASKIPWWKIALGGAAALGVGYLTLVRPAKKTGDRRLTEARKLASDVGLTYGMTEEEKDRAFDTYYKKKGYPSYLLSTAPKFTT